MLKKLLKHDFKRSSRFGVPILLGLLLAAILGAVNTYQMVSLIEAMASEEAGFFSVLSTIGAYLMFILIITAVGAAATVLTVMILVDFYKSLVSDEAYLTHTLPVKPSSLINSKLINAFIWTLIVGIATAFVVFAMILGGILAGDVSSDPGIEGEMIFPDGLWLTGILGLLTLLSYVVNGNLIYFMAIMFGSVIAKKNKGIVSVGCVFGINFIYGTFSSIIMTVLMFTGLGFEGENPLIGLNILLAIGFALLSGLNVLFYYLTKFMMEKKLNLE